LVRKFTVTYLAPLVLTLFVIGAWSSFAQQQRVKIRARDFEAPTQTSEGKRSVVKGADARHIGNEIYEIVSARVTLFNPDDTVDMEIESPLCHVNLNRGSPESQVTTSSTNLLVKTGDGKFSIQGVGWRWDPERSTLNISNQVVALIRKSAITATSTNISATSTNKSTGTNTHIRVTSNTFEHKGNIAVFAGAVLVQDGPDTLNCEILRVHFEEAGGVHLIEAEERVHLVQKDTEAIGGKAIYNVKENTIRLLDKPAWRMGAREGRSEILLVHRTNNTFHAEGNVYMKLPYTNSVSASASPGSARKATGTNSFVEIYSDYFDYFGGEKDAKIATAYYRGNVRVLQTDGEIICRFLTVLFSPKENRLMTVIAEDDVQIRSGRNIAFGQKAVYELIQEKITLTGNPHWVIDDKEGSSDVMIFFPQSDELLALQNVRMKLPSAGEGQSPLFSPGQRRKEPVARGTNSFMTVTSDLFSRKDNVSVFRDNVHVQDQQGSLRAEILTVLTSGTNQVQRIVAKHNVILEQKDMIATGQQAVYSLDTGLVELTGNPRIKQPGRNVTADIFIINRPENTFTMRGQKWKIEMVAKKKNENQGAPAP
jgi:lipopolysaccharide export system protein LptA